MNFLQADIPAIAGPEYAFLRTNPHLGDNICLLTYGGSHAYGTNVEGSDVDIRGIALNSAEEILLGHDFEQVTDKATDTTIYSFRKAMQLLANCNPNVIELLGCKEYLYLDEIGKTLVDNAHMFLSKRCIYTFGGYANAQLRRLQNRAMHNLAQEEKERHIQKSIEHASLTFREQVAQYPDDAFRIYPDVSEKPEMDTEMYVDIKLKHYPLRDLNVLSQDVSAIIRDYDKIGHRNANAYTKARIAKHSMHLVRLYSMAIDLLERGEIRTYRDEDHDFLMDIRNGKYLDEAGQPVAEFFSIVDELERKMSEAAERTTLPDKPDWSAIERFVMDVNRRVVESA